MQLVILATFFNENSYNLEKALIDLVTLENGTASTIFESVVSSLKDKDIPVKTSLVLVLIHGMLGSVKIIWWQNF